MPGHRATARETAESCFEDGPAGAARPGSNVRSVSMPRAPDAPSRRRRSRSRSASGSLNEVMTWSIRPSATRAWVTSPVLQAPLPSSSDAHNPIEPYEDAHCGFMISSRLARNFRIPRRLPPGRDDHLVRGSPAISATPTTGTRARASDHMYIARHRPGVGAWIRADQSIDIFERTGADEALLGVDLTQVNELARRR